MMFRKNLLFVLIFFNTLLIQAQTIEGFVTNYNDQYLVNTTIQLIQPKDSTVLKASSTDSNGRYEIRGVQKGKYILKISHVQYLSEFISIETENPVTLLNFKLELKTNEMKEITIVAKKNIYEYKSGKIIFHVENSIGSQGADLLTTLKKAPGVLIKNNSITLAGKSSVGVMMNGRLQQMSGEDLNAYLKSIPGNTVSKIEIIQSPSSGFDAEGDMGIINIITKKPIGEGFKGNLNASFTRNHHNMPSVGINSNYRKNKLNVFCNLSYYKIGYDYTSKTSTYFTDNSWYQLAKIGSDATNTRVQSGVEYMLSHKTTLGFSYAYSWSQTINQESTLATNFDNNTGIKGYTKTTGKTTDRLPSRHLLNINAEHRIDSTGKKINIDYDLFAYRMNKQRDFNIGNYLPDNTKQSESINRLTGNPNYMIQSLKADIDLPTKFAKYTLGVKGAFVHNKVQNVTMSLQNQVYVNDTAGTNAFDYEEQTQAAYIQASKGWKQLSIQIGVRVEHTFIKGISTTMDRTDIQDYTKLFPSCMFEYQMNDKNTFNFTANRRIRRPDYSNLNPFRFYYTESSFSEGNPALQPSTSNKFQISYVYKGTYNISFMYNQSRNYFDRLFFIDSAKGTSNITRANIGRTYYYGAFVSGAFTPLKWWEINGDLNVGYNQFNPETKDANRYTSIIFYGNANNAFYLNKSRTFVGELNGYYYTPRQNDYKLWKKIWAVNIGLRAVFYQKKLSVAIYGDDIFATSYWLQINQQNGTNEYSYDDERAIRISCTYKFGNQKVKGKHERSGVDEIQRASN